MSNSLWPHGLQHARLLCPSLSPGVCSDSCRLSQWYHPTISSSVALFSSCPPSFPASGKWVSSFPGSQLFASGDQNIEASVSVLPKSIQGWLSLGWLVWSPCGPRDSRESFPAPQFKSIDSLDLSLLWSNSNIHTWLLEKTLTIWTFVSKVISLLFNMLSSFIMGLPLWLSWLKNLPAMRETWVQSQGLRRSPGEGKGYPLQYSGVQNSMNCIVHGVTKSWTQLNNFHFH